MTIKEDLLRVYEYGRTPYYQAIREQPTYQKELGRTLRDYNQRTWWDPLGIIPKFTTPDFNKRREKYQEKYGTSINIPGFNDVIQIKPKAKISAEEMAAQRFAFKRGLPSPLTDEQQRLLTYKKYRFLKALASPTPTWLKNYGAVATSLDNLEDALVTIVVAGRIAVKIAPRLLGKAVPLLGWLLTGSDILNAVNLFSYLRVTKRGCKGVPEDLAERNPFHAKAKANRVTRLKRTMPTIGEILEILQTTDQLLGTGLCLGGLMGMVWDTAAKIIDPDYWLGLNRTLASGNVHEISDWISRAAVNDYYSVKRALQQQWSQFKDESYRLKAWDQGIRNAVFNWADKKSKETWGWIKTLPQPGMSDFPDTLIGSMIINTGMQDFSKEEHTKGYMFLNQAMTGLMPWWLENDPISNFKELREWKWRVPEPTDPSTLDLLEESIPNWKETVAWPHLDKREATFEEIFYTYAPMIKESFQTYCLAHRYEYEAMVAAYECTDFVKNVIRSYDDNQNVRCGMTAWWAAAKDMVDYVYLIPPDTPQPLIDSLADWIGNYERQTGGPAKIHDIFLAGQNIGIKWERSFPAKTFRTVAEQFPEWAALQDQIGDLYFPD